MAATPPELSNILEQVQAELTAMLSAGEIGTVTIHCGRNDLSVEVMAKRRHAPVRLEPGKALTIIRSTR